MNDLILKALEFVVIVATIVIIRYVIPWIKGVTAYNEEGIVYGIVQTAVQYAEQTMTGGAVKKEAVMEYLFSIFQQKGIGIREDQLNALVEAAVYAMNQEKNNKN